MDGPSRLARLREHAHRLTQHLKHHETVMQKLYPREYPCRQVCQWYGAAAEDPACRTECATTGSSWTLEQLRAHVTEHYPKDAQRLTRQPSLLHWLHRVLHLRTWQHVLQRDGTIYPPWLEMLTLPVALEVLPASYWQHVLEQLRDHPQAQSQLEARWNEFRDDYTSAQWSDLQERKRRAGWTPKKASKKDG